MEHDIYRMVVCHLMTSYRHARKHKSNTPSCIRFSMELEDEIDELARTIIGQTYEMRRSVRFAVEQPVLREVIAADFRDRVPHHFVFDYVNPHLELELIDDCYSCRVGKGTSYGVDRLEHHIRSCSQNYTRPCWVLQLDISGYFMSIDRHRLLAKAEALMDRIGKKCDEDGRQLGLQPRHRLVAYLLRLIILYDPLERCEVHDRKHLLKLLPPSKTLACSPDGVGMPIGNLTSQMLSNLYLNEFCQWVKRVLRVKHFGDYVDDSYYVGCSAEWLLSLVPQVDNYLKGEGLHLNLAKTKLTNVWQGVSFLGIHLKPYRRYVKNRTLVRMRRQVEDMRRVTPWELEQPGTKHHLLSSANSFLGVLGKTASYHLRVQLFPNYPMFNIAYGNKAMKKFKIRDCPVAAACKTARERAQK